MISSNKITNNDNYSISEENLKFDQRTILTKFLESMPENLFEKTSITIFGPIKRYYEY